MFACGWKFRVLAGMAFGLALGWADPALTTVQDTLFKANGAPFSGFALIEWQSFEAADASNIATSSLTVPIVNGVIYVQLVPNGSGSSYAVRYVSDGKAQFQEIWVVPASPTPLGLKDVRATAAPSSSGSGSGGSGGAGQDTQIPESSVVGLLADLAMRPQRGAGYAPARAVGIDSAGLLQAVGGNLTDCVRVNGTSGPCGSAGTGPGFVDGETPAGLINGSNAVFTVGNPPAPAGSLALYRNGLLQAQNVDYSVAGNVITFAPGSLPLTGDTLMATYRLADAGNPVGVAGGSLSGYFPNPTLAAAVVTDANVSATAAIQEYKLALNFATHSNGNDPSAGQKAALAGTAGSPADTNRFVTAMDSRLTDPRAPLTHSLLGSAHSDTAAASATRGDLIVAQGTTAALWARLPLGAANRCLMSNGADAVWNTCLYTAFPQGSIPFADASGNLAQNSSQLSWDNGNRKLSVGNNSDSATLYLWDAQVSVGLTALVVRAGQGQGSVPLGRWLDPSGNELARVDPDGRVLGPSFHAATSATRAAWEDAGSATDPSARSDGDAWYNTSSQARKTAEGGQAHTAPQVLCGSAGAATSSTSLTSLATCTIPAGFLQAGDRADIRFDYSHEGTATGFTFEVHWGSTTLVSRSATASETAAGGRVDTGVHVERSPMEGGELGRVAGIRGVGRQRLGFSGGAADRVVPGPHGRLHRRHRDPAKPDRGSISRAAESVKRARRGKRAQSPCVHLRPLDQPAAAAVP